VRVGRRIFVRPWLEDRAQRQMQDLPSEAFDVLARTYDDPYNRCSARSRRRAGQAHR
jgi:hypothetical protein